MQHIVIFQPLIWKDVRLLFIKCNSNTDLFYISMSINDNSKNSQHHTKKALVAPLPTSHPSLFLEISQGSCDRVGKVDDCLKGPKPTGDPQKQMSVHNEKVFCENPLKYYDQFCRRDCKDNMVGNPLTSPHATHFQFG